MPLVRVEILKGKTQEYKKAILDGVHAALVEAFKIPDDDRTQCLYELEKDCFEIPPGKTGKMTLIELTVFKGRSLEARKISIRPLSGTWPKRRALTEMIF